MPGFTYQRGLEGDIVSPSISWAQGNALEAGLRGETIRRPRGQTKYVIFAVHWAERLGMEVPMAVCKVLLVVAVAIVLLTSSPFSALSKGPDDPTCKPVQIGSTVPAE